MEITRGRSTPVGRAMAENLKQKRKTLNELVAKKTTEIFGRNAQFSRLSAADKNRVFGEIVKSAGKSNLVVTARMRKLSHAGRGLLVLSLAISVYAVATSDQKASTLKREVATTGAGILGGATGGAHAGLAFGPGAPVSVTVGAFVGGAMAAFGVHYFW